MKTMMIRTQISTVRRCLALATSVIAFAPATAGLAQAPAAGDSPPAAAETTDYRPKKYTAGRYRSVYSNSAFEREILPPDKPEAGPPPTPFDLKIVSVTGKDGRYRVVLIDKKGKYQVVTDTPDADGFHYSDIEPSPKIQDFRVQVVKGAQSEWAEFDTKRYSIASKKIAPPAPTNRDKRPSVVPNTRTPPPGRAASSTQAPAAPAAKAASQKAGAAAQAAIQTATSNAVNSSSSSRSRVNGRRVVLPPKNR
jgi:hypothetical protein